jgi:pyruvate,orthophosphate dikinase
MLGLRGCRLGIAFPEITEMQVRAILEAACIVKNKGADPHPEIMIPLVGSVEEMRNQAIIVRRVAEEVFKEKGVTVDYKVGTMIELPRAALTADQIAEEAEFFSFGTNDLTQTTFGISRDDINQFLPAYMKAGIFKQDPFATLDQAGVGQLVQLAVNKGRSTRPNIKLGICGEHGGDPESVKFCHRIGLTYVSCSPFRLLTARLAAAQAAIEEKQSGPAHTTS